MATQTQHAPDPSILKALHTARALAHARLRVNAQALADVVRGVLMCLPDGSRPIIVPSGASPVVATRALEQTCADLDELADIDAEIDRELAALDAELRAR